MRRMLMMQDRAAIAKGLREGCLLRRITGADHGGSVSVVSREIRRNGGKCGYQPVWQLMWTHLKRRTWPKAPQDRCRIGSSRLGCWRI